MSAPSQATAVTSGASAQAEALRGRWTGGQYSAFRFVLGVSLLGHFAWLLLHREQLVGGVNAGMLTAALAVGCVLHVLLALGWQDRGSALAAAALWAALLGRDPFMPAAGQGVLVVMLVLHAAMPAVPYGSWRARGRLDPRGDWRPAALPLRMAWLLLAGGLSFAAAWRLGSEVWRDGSVLAASLEGPLSRQGALGELLLGLPALVLEALSWGVLGFALLFGPLALSARLRPWLWLILLALNLCLPLLFDVTGLVAAVLMLQLFCFDPAWLKARGGPGASTVFYDGYCGLCHRFVRYLLAEDVPGDTFVYAPLQGDSFQQTVPAENRVGLPDSVVVLTPCGDLLMRSDAALHCLRRLGGLWRFVAACGRLVPRPLRDGVYNVVAAARSSLFAKPDAACPILPADLARRFRG